MKERILKELDDLIADLQLELSPEEVSNGWLPQSQAATLSLLRKTRETVLKGDELPELSMGRGLDHWGVEGGPLFEKVCAVSNHLREFGNP